LSDSPQEISLGLVAENADSHQSDEDFDELGDGLIASEERIATLQGELEAVAEQETEMARELDTRRELRATVERQLFEVRKEAARLMLIEASRTRGAMLAEAEESLEASRLDAEREAGRIIKTASDQAHNLLAEARRDADAILDDGRERLSALEAEIADRVADLDTERQDLAHQLSTMATIYDNLQATLQLVAETSIKELVAAKSSLAQLDPSTPNTPRRRSSEKQPSSDPDPNSA
jgi:cell division septum initiation protein DivIVA